ncbi:voltage-gated chloride channel family protein [Siphonobacter sp. SORGH_AS_1065]|uniref:voltage-gated chloride channel family protein n=1 Tax=Siphonobacter sp. SORGH_AS_1065 TaxID=3041795 RepID=UPI00278972F9|nr:voltage-gated chloride channel family protein [Siphonobacter sp. SORGH_AS_1065]MDQ1087540.1 H+/Cl- antiporter ClcA [Siphonobacter sp. SORGH_AS_1065]
MPIVTKLNHPFIYLLRWLGLNALVGTLVGSASAFFLVSLDAITQYRESHLWIIALLPLGGFLVGAIYHYWGESVVKGNNQLIEEWQNPTKIIPFKMAPLVLITTLLTHVFGGSAGREGTAVQMGGAIADQFTKLFKLSNIDRKTLLVTGISAGFASVFGTPLAGTIFALEVFIIGQLGYEALIPSLLAALFADQTCHWWGVGHTHYAINLVPAFSVSLFIKIALASMAFGLISRLFAELTHFWARQVKTYISFPPFRPMLGGIFIALAIWLSGTTKYIGLGIPTIVSSFHDPLPWYDWIMKTLSTTFTLGVGFKGGEVTPLFFIGATFGNAAAQFLQLPVGLMAGIGFVAVFAGASNTPLASTIMGIELFGTESAPYLALACFIAYLFSGNAGIYRSQKIGSGKF